MQPAQIPDSQSQVFDLLREHPEKTDALLRNIKQHRPKLEEMLAHVESHWCMEDGFYRFYHQSFKVYHLQELTTGICEALQSCVQSVP